MFGVPVEKTWSERSSPARPSWWPSATAAASVYLKAMGALDMGLKEEELQPLGFCVAAVNPNIVAFWWDVDDAVKTAIRMRTATETHGIRFVYQSAMLFIQLPSGRRLAYVKPKIGENKFGGESVTYEGVGATKNGSESKVTARNSWKTLYRQSAGTSCVTPCGR